MVKSQAKTYNFSTDRNYNISLYNFYALNGDSFSSFALVFSSCYSVVYVGYRLIQEKLFTVYS